MNWKDRIEQYKMRKNKEQVEKETAQQSLYKQQLEELLAGMDKLGIYKKLTELRDEILEYGTVKTNTSLNHNFKLRTIHGHDLGTQKAAILCSINVDLPNYIAKHTESSSYGSSDVAEWDVESVVEWKSLVCANILVCSSNDGDYNVSVFEQEFEIRFSPFIVQDCLTFQIFDDPEVEKWLEETLIVHAAEYRSFKPDVESSYSSLKTMLRFDSHLIDDRVKDWLQKYESENKDL